jgi:hypothetical protein
MFFSEDASKHFGGWVVKFKGIEVRLMLLQKWNEGSKYNYKNALIDPEKMYSIMAC